LFVAQNTRSNSTRNPNLPHLAALPSGGAALFFPSQLRLSWKTEFNPQTKEFCIMENVLNKIRNFNISEMSPWQAMVALWLLLIAVLVGQAGMTSVLTLLVMNTIFIAVPVAIMCKWAADSVNEQRFGLAYKWRNVQ
jgi:hypothetical protein